MDEVIAILNKLQSIVDSIENIIREEVIKEQSFIAELNREQLMNGIKGDGSDMPLYSPRSKQPNAPGKIVLFDLGDFHAGINPLFEEEGFEMISTDSKTEILKEKYEESILDLTQESIDKLKERIRPNIIERLKQLT